MVVVALLVLGWVTTDLLLGGPLTRLDHRIAGWVWATRLRHGNLPRALLLHAGTMPGDPLGVGLLVAPFVAWLSWRRRSWQPVLRFLVALGVVTLVVGAAKYGVGRSAPGVLDRLHVAGRSYPSGHSARAVVLAGVVSGLAREAGLPATWQRLLQVLAVLAPVTTAACMVLLDYHWLTDVLAGLAVGVLLLRLTNLAFAGRLGDWSYAYRPGRVGAGRAPGGPRCGAVPTRTRVG